MVVRPYVPDTGDLIWVTVDPEAGHEQGGRRPALVLSPRQYNVKTQLALACPITSKVKGYPFEVEVPPGGIITGVVLADQLKNLDWHARNATFESKAPLGLVTEVRERIRPLLGF